MLCLQVTRYIGYLLTYL